MSEPRLPDTPFTENVEFVILELGILARLYFTVAESKVIPEAASAFNVDLIKPTDVPESVISIVPDVPKAISIPFTVRLLLVSLLFAIDLLAIVAMTFESAKLLSNIA